MPEDSSTLAKLVRTLVGRPCIAAEIGLDRTLRLAFLPDAGQSKELAPKVQSIASAWRILRGRDVVCGQADCEDWERGLEPHLAALFGQILRRVSIEHLGPIDVRFEFEQSGLAVEFLEISSSEPAWQIDISSNQSFEIGPNGDLREEPTSLSELEAAIAHHSEEFAARIGVLPTTDSPEHRCGACAYWRSLTGGFHFWDYGVCTNLHSPSDGRATHKTGGCAFFGTEPVKT